MGNEEEDTMKTPLVWECVAQELGSHGNIPLTAAHTLSCPRTGLVSHTNTALLLHLAVGYALQNNGIVYHTKDSEPVGARHHMDITTKPGLV